MCWGMIGYDYKGPFYVWEAETKEEKEEAKKEIARLNKLAKEEEDKKNAEWEASEEWKELKKRELEAARIQRKASRELHSPGEEESLRWKSLAEETREGLMLGGM
jgi:hypothetical protein